MTQASKPMRVLAYAALLAAAPVVSAQAEGEVSISLPQETAVYKAGQGQELANSHCLMCHSADYVYMQPPMAKENWVATVNKMKKVFGCPIDDQNVEALADYLAEQNGK